MEASRKSIWGWALYDWANSVFATTVIAGFFPIFFKQLRSGINNKEFFCYKFRTMNVNLYSDEKQATKKDPRITSFGRFLRRSNLDEFPQFVNVLFGDMSVVGPRPHMIKHTNQY